MTDETEHLIEEQPLSTYWGAMVKFGPAIIVGLFYVTAVLHYAYTPDDTYIYLQYAKNLASGNGFAFDANTPSYGITGPLWVLLIAAGAKAGLDPLVVAKTFDILFAGLSIILVYTIAVTLIQSKIHALFAALIVSSDAWFLRWSGSGMETSFAVILVLIAVKYAYLGDYHIAGFVTGLLTLVRPEGIFLFIILQIENFITSYLLGRNKHLFWSSSLLYLVVVLPWVVFSYETFGSIVPNTEFAKTAFHWSLRGVASATFDSMAILGSTELLMILLLIVGIPLIISKGGIGTFVAKGMPILWILALPLGYIMLNVQVVSRYLVPVIPLIVIYALWGLRQMEVSFRWSPRKALIVLCAIAFATIVQSQVIYRITVVPHMQEFVKGMDRGIKPIAVWLRTNSSEDASVLTPDGGLLGYSSGREIFDTAGLITPAVKRAFDGVGYDEGMKQRLYRTAIRPDYVVDRAMTKERLSSDSLRPIMTTEFGALGRKKPETIYYTLYKVTE